MNIREALFDFLQSAIEEDLVIIYFLGHGAPDPKNSKNLYLLAYDSDPEKMSARGFPMWDIETVLKRTIKANKVVVIADACHSGGVSGQIAQRSVDVRSNPINAYLKQLAKAKPTTAILTASEAGEASLEGTDWGHGVYTHFWLKGLNGEADRDKDGIVTLGEIIDYTNEWVRRETNNNQHPDTAGRFDRNLPMAVGR